MTTSERNLLIKKALARAEKEIVNPVTGYEMGDCHRIWPRAKEILWTEHRIRWKSPSDLEPLVIFD